MMNAGSELELMNELEARHRRLHDEVRLLENRAYLTPEEQRRVSELKKAKLLAKDELYAARRRASEPPPA